MADMITTTQAAALRGVARVTVRRGCAGGIHAGCLGRRRAEGGPRQLTPTLGGGQPPPPTKGRNDGKGRDEK